MGFFSNKKKGKEREMAEVIPDTPPLGPPVSRATLEQLKAFWRTESEARQKRSLKAREAFGKCSVECLKREQAALEALCMYCEVADLRPTYNVNDSLADQTFVPQSVRKQAKLDHEALHADCCQLGAMPVRYDTHKAGSSRQAAVKRLSESWGAEFGRRQAKSAEICKAFGKCSAEHLQQEQLATEAFIMYDALDLEQPPFDVKDCLADETFVPASVTEEARAEEQMIHTNCCQMKAIKVDKAGEESGVSTPHDKIDTLAIKDDLPPPSYVETMQGG